MASNHVIGRVKAIPEPNSLKFKWEINSFKIRGLARLRNCGDFLESPKFTPDLLNSNAQWYLRLYSAKHVLQTYGYMEGYEDYYGYDYDNGTEKMWACYLYANDEEEPARNFVILNDLEDRICLTHDEASEHVRLLPEYYVLDPRGGMLKGNKLTILCEITRSNKRKRAVVEEQEGDNRTRIEALLSNNRFSDVRLVSEGKALNAHKCILANCSSVFAAMFDADDTSESQEDTVEIADVTYDVLVEMIRFVYTGKAKNIDALADELAVAADKYALDGLKNFCEKIMITNLSLGSAIGYLELADGLRMDKLKKRAIEFIVENASDVSEKQEFKLLSYDTVCELFRCLAKKSR